VIASRVCVSSRKITLLTVEAVRIGHLSAADHHLQEAGRLTSALAKPADLSASALATAEAMARRRSPTT